MATNHLQRPHYDNNLMVSKEGKPLATVGDDRVQWYLDRNLAMVVPWHDPHYKRVIQLKFVHAGNDDGRPGDLIRMENRCVVCGTDASLSLHHVTPYSVKRHYPLRDKTNTRNLCVLLCEEHHLRIEEVNRQLTDGPYDLLEPHFKWVNRWIGLYFRWLKKWAVRYWRWRKGGVKAINTLYIQTFLNEMQPKHLPKDWLQP